MTKEMLGGNVVRLLSTTEIIVDIGWNDGVKVGDKARVVVYGDEIFDNSGASLGTYTYVKADLQVVKTEPKFSIISKIESHRVGNSPYSNLIEQMSKSLSGIYGPSRTVEEVLPLKVNTDEMEPLKSHAPADLTINKGDDVQIIV